MKLTRSISVQLLQFRNLLCTIKILSFCNKYCRQVYAATFMICNRVSAHSFQLFAIYLSSILSSDHHSPPNAFMPATLKASPVQQSPYADYASGLSCQSCEKCCIRQNECYNMIAIFLYYAIDLTEQPII